MFSFMRMSTFFVVLIMFVYNNFADTDQVLTRNSTPSTMDNEDCEGNCISNCLQYNNDTEMPDNITRYCMHCIPGYYGFFCQYECNENCIESENGTNICHQSSGECSRCKNGYFGRFCSDNCSGNCLNESAFDTCNISTGKCHKCNPNFYGDFCQKECFENCDTCDRNTGICNNCKSNFYGESCNFTCPVNCSAVQNNTTNKKVCQRKTGECLTCKSGLYGTKCDHTCPSKCGKHFSELNKQKCVKSTGHCITCEIGYYGNFCELTCHKTCQKIRQFGSLCAQTDGKCSFGCIDGWYGSMCQHMCNTTCKDRTCDLWKEQCSKECIVGYEGHLCERKQIYLEPEALGDVITVNEGAFIEDINCVSICNPVCDIEWKRNSNTVNDSRSERLNLDRAFREKAGVYTCLVKDPRLSKTFSKNVTVNIRYGPDLLHIFPQEKYLSIETGKTAPLIKCIADCFPSCNFQWTKHNDTSMLVNNDTLQFGIVTHNHSGVYTCIATNSAEEYPKSNSLSLEIEITALKGNNGTILSNSMVLVIGACSVVVVVIAVSVGAILLKCKRKRRRVEAGPPVYEECSRGDLCLQTSQERTSGGYIYDEVVQEL